MTHMREMDHGISYKPHYKASSKLVLLSSSQIKEAKVAFTKADPKLAEAIRILTVYILVYHGYKDVVVHLAGEHHFPFKWWLEAFGNLFKDKPLNPPDNLVELRILVCRLASSRARYIIPTGENDLILQRINHPSRPSKAYWAACMTVGSLYYFPLRESQGSTQQTLFDTGFLTRPASAASTNLEGTTPMEEDIPIVLLLQLIPLPNWLPRNPPPLLMKSSPLSRLVPIEQTTRMTPRISPSAECDSAFFSLPKMKPLLTSPRRS
jgi:hypothetical protein